MRTILRCAVIPIDARMRSSDTVNVLLVDDHAAVREGYRRLLERSASIRVVGEAADARAKHTVAFLEFSRTSLIMDISPLPGASGYRVRCAHSRTRSDCACVDVQHVRGTDFRFALAVAWCARISTRLAAPEALVDAVPCVARGELLDHRSYRT